jgi:hypothetical protein
VQVLLQVPHPLPQTPELLLAHPVPEQQLVWPGLLPLLLLLLFPSAAGLPSALLLARAKVPASAPEELHCVQRQG